MADVEPFDKQYYLVSEYDKEYDTVMNLNIDLDSLGGNRKYAILLQAHQSHNCIAGPRF